MRLVHLPAHQLLNHLASERISIVPAGHQMQLRFFRHLIALIDTGEISYLTCERSSVQALRIARDAFLQRVGWGRAMRFASAQSSCLTAAYFLLPPRGAQFHEISSHLDPKKAAPKARQFRLAGRRLPSRSEIVVRGNATRLSPVSAPEPFLLHARGRRDR